jgi:sugar phosphate isomerase/epimerase
MQPLALGLIIPAADPIAGLERVQSLGFPTCQLSCVGGRFLTSKTDDALREAMQRTGVEVTTLFLGFDGESYADIPTIQRTVGLIPDDVREERIRVALEMSDRAKAFGFPVLAAHIGFVPEVETDPTFKAVVEAMQRICDRCAGNGQKFALETGQEPAVVLHDFIHNVNRENLGINFDPANMILYGTGDPIEALHVVGHHVVGAHAKDGKWPLEKGTLGTETPLGEGDVGMARFINKLKEVGYRGALTIEREIEGEEQTKDILRGKALLEGLI